MLYYSHTNRVQEIFFVHKLHGASGNNLCHGRSVSRTILRKKRR